VTVSLCAEQQRKEKTRNRIRSLCDCYYCIARVRLGKREEAAFYLSRSCSRNCVINENVLHFFFLSVMLVFFIILVVA